MIPKSGAGYSYIYETYGPPLAFMYGWVSFLLIRPAGIAGIALVFAEYVTAPFFVGGNCDPPDVIIKLLAIACIGKKTQYKKKGNTFKTTSCCIYTAILWQKEASDIPSKFEFVKVSQCT